MRHPATKVIAAVALVCLLPAAGLALTPYSQNFESLVATSLTALSADGWVVYGNVFTPLGVWSYGYGVFPAPNAGSAFCTIDAGQGGLEQGAQQLSVFSDYENTGHATGMLIESNVFHEQTITTGDVGNTWVFAFDGKRGNLTGLSIAKAFVKTLNPAAGYATTNFLTVDMTTAPVTWVNHSISIVINAGLVGQLLQFGFTNTATYYESSGIFYDNVDFHLYDPSGVPSGGVTVGAQLRQNYPNPFNPSTRIEFVLDRASNVEVAVFDLAGRHLVTLQQGALDAGEHAVTWDGCNGQGAAVSAGQYQYVLKTDAGRLVRSMVLLK